jgi:hypothetical protein
VLVWRQRRLHFLPNSMFDVGSSMFDVLYLSAYRATPWVPPSPVPGALKARDMPGTVSNHTGERHTRVRSYAAPLQGLASDDTRTQGLARGWYVTHLWR